jgi:hypothetical protein
VLTQQKRNSSQDRARAQSKAKTAVFEGTRTAVVEGARTAAGQQLFSLPLIRDVSDINR